MAPPPIGRREAVENIVDVGVSMDVMLALHDMAEGWDHRENEIVSGQYHKSRI
jgi:hypothetical protein